MHPQRLGYAVTYEWLLAYADEHHIKKTPRRIGRIGKVLDHIQKKANLRVLRLFSTQVGNQPLAVLSFAGVDDDDDQIQPTLKEIRRLKRVMKQDDEPKLYPLINY